MTLHKSFSMLKTKFPNTESPHLPHICTMSIILCQNLPSAASGDSATCSKQLLPFYSGMKTLSSLAWQMTHSSFGHGDPLQVTHKKCLPHLGTETSLYAVNHNSLLFSSFGYGDPALCSKWLPFFLYSGMDTLLYTANDSLLFEYGDPALHSEWLPFLLFGYGDPALHSELLPFFTRVWRPSLCSEWLLWVFSLYSSIETLPYTEYNPFFLLFGYRHPTLCSKITSSGPSLLSIH